MECSVCGRRIGRGKRFILLTLACRHRVGYVPVGDEAPLCTRSCAARLLAGDGFLHDLMRIPLGERRG